MPDNALAMLQLLRCEFTAVNQQFSHILSLRARGEDEAALRIAEVNDVYFSNAMRIADYMIQSRMPVRLGGDHYTPGCATPAVLLAEQEMLRRMEVALAKVDPADGTQQQLIADAQAPNEAYKVWLGEQLAREHEIGRRVTQPEYEVEELVAHLLAMMEQAIVHALMHRHVGDTPAADGSWATSGMAMMHLTYLIRYFSSHNVTPGPGRYPPIRIPESPASAPEYERAMAAQCATAALIASSAVESPLLATLCDAIGEMCEKIADWSPDEQHPALESNPPAFFSFDRSYEKYVRLN